jgi:uracil-DNA glycosylase family 4
MRDDVNGELLHEVRAFLAFQGELKLRGVTIPEAAMLRSESSRSEKPTAEEARTERPTTERPRTEQPRTEKPTTEQPTPETALSLPEIRSAIGDCTRCKLCKGRTNIVFGVGDPRAKLMFVGEGPGRDEDEQGEPFVGAAGQLLNKMIEAMGLARSDVYIANVVKCRPPNNRDPEPDEVAACEPFLKQQIAAVQPQVIVALGRYAAQTLLRDSTPVTRMRGKWREYESTPLMPTYHPAYLLRNPGEKRPVWQDLQTVMARLSSSS